jgi:RNA polymerase sigma-70 factor (ECF subfamily)
MPAERDESHALLVELVQRYRPLIERLCVLLLRDPGEGEDAAQQTFLLAYQSILSGARPRRPKAWLCAIARRECWSRAQRRRREPVVSEEQAVETLDPSDRTALRAELATIFAELGQLPARQRQAIVLRELGGLSYRQLAAALETSESAAEALLVRARRALRRARPLVALLLFPRSLHRALRLTGDGVRAGTSLAVHVAAGGATVLITVGVVAGAGAPVHRAVQFSTVVPRSAAQARPAARAAKPRQHAPARTPRRLGRRSVVPARSPGHARVVVAMAAATPVAVATTAGSGAADTGASSHLTAPPAPFLAASPRPSTTPKPKPVHRTDATGHSESKAGTARPPATTAPPTPDPAATSTETEPSDAPPTQSSADPSQASSGTGVAGERGTVDGSTPGADPTPPAATVDHSDHPDHRDHADKH